MAPPFYAAVADDFELVNQLIRQSLTSRVPLVEEIAEYLIQAGGKRLRPLLALLSAKACGYNKGQHIKLAAVIEFLHTAMLLHDDVVDESMLRRGRKTVNAAWGNPASVLVGDFLHSRAFEMMVEIGDMDVMKILSHSTNVISEGEVQQLTNIRNPALTEAAYMQVIERKTAALFEASSHSAAALAGATQDQAEALRNYGLQIGLAFQLVDDVLDYEGSSEELGKNVGDDLAEGKVTLPLIVAMRKGSDKDTEFIRNAIRTGGLEHLDATVEIVRRTKGLEYTMQRARTCRNAALENAAALPGSRAKEAMIALAHATVDRVN
ncbi:MAG: octaprenyl diphosphate synthase [Gammaproteobacteria bacterium]|nr:octaprenyl diphosphate synthase [Gammaproteobacteria bacterium]